MYGFFVNKFKAPAVASIVYLAVAGLCAIFLNHALRAGLVEYVGLDSLHVDLIVSAEMLGILICTAVLSYIAPRYNWRELMAIFLARAATGNAISALMLDNIIVLGLLRIIVGIGAGGIIALAASMMALTDKTDRNFGLAFAAMMACAAIGTLLVPVLSEWLSFSSLITLMALVYFGGFLVVRHVPRGGNTLQQESPVPNVSSTAQISSLFAVMIYGLAVGLAISSFFNAGLDAGVEIHTFSQVITFALFVGAIGSGMVALVQLRLGRLFPVVISLVGILCASVLILFASTEAVYWLGLGLFALLWSVGTPCILANLAEFDDRGSYVLYGVCLHLVGYALGIYPVPLVSHWYHFVDLSNLAIALLFLSICLMMPGLWAVHQRHKMTEAVIL